jgi:tRNA(Ile)-lysidine synthase
MSSRFLIPHSSLLIQKRNLLAFSAGIDSSALFFLLIENGIPFDIAIVDYGLRVQSKEEVGLAKTLAQKYDLRCFSTKAPQFDSHFEAQARKFRYDFFESLIKEHGYDNLLTAHQLNDQLEWLLMRLSKGAGVSELLGLEPVSHREGYTLLRPLLSYSKEELLEYLKVHDHPYFIDESNTDETYERNAFRKAFSDPMIDRYKEGIKRSFDYLRRDKAILASSYETVLANKQLRILRLHDPSAKVRAADRILKELGYLLSAAQRREIEKESSMVIGGEWVVEIQDDMLYIAPYLTEKIPKRFKETCRIQCIPKKIRPYLFKEDIPLDTLP